MHFYVVNPYQGVKLKTTGEWVTFPQIGEMLSSYTGTSTCYFGYNPNAIITYPFTGEKIAQHLELMYGTPKSGYKYVDISLDNNNSYSAEDNADFADVQVSFFDL